ncbi:hypothetical protein P7C71_g792, partial [Lecanoromycetidae sp. Uapishka_2]
MHYTPFILLACSSLALASPYNQHHHYQGKWENHAHAHEACSSDSASAALPFAVESTASAGYPIMPPSPAEVGTVSTALSSAAPVAGTGTGSDDEGGEELKAEKPPSLPYTSALTTAPAPVVVASSTPVAVQASAAQAVAPAAGATSAPASGTVYDATFTSYGAGDTFGSGNCNTDTAACGFYSNPGFNAAVSQNLYGLGPGQGKSLATCGLCYKLTGGENPYDGDAAVQVNSVVVKINNLCPIAGNPLCNQTSLTGAPGTTNQFGATVNFDLCRDDGAASALFAGIPTSIGVQKGTATEVPCSEWSGTDLTKRWLKV